MKKIKDSEINAEIIADYFLSKKSMSQKKLQKIVYYAYAWFIALYNENPNDIKSRLFEERPQAWIHGPVFPSLYAKYSDNGWHEIPQSKEIAFENKELQEFLDTIYEKFNNFSADELEAMTHSETPWREARSGITSTEPSNTEISDETIFVFYNKLAATE